MTNQPQQTSFARIVVTPILVLIAAGIIGSLLDAYLAALAIGAALSIVYIIVASRRGK